MQQRVTSGIGLLTTTVLVIITYIALYHIKQEMIRLRYRPQGACQESNHVTSLADFIAAEDEGGE